MADNSRLSFGDGDEESQTHSSKSFSYRIQAVNSFPPSTDDETKRCSVEDEDGWSGKNKRTFLLVQKLGLLDFLSLDVWRAAVAEGIGSAVLVFVLDTIVISSFESETKMANLVMSILIAIFATIIILATFPISGGHINPIISFSAALVGIVSMTRALIYISAQCAGAVLGAQALRAVVSDAIEDNFSLGGCTIRVETPGPNGPILIGLETDQAFGLEFLCSFVLLFAVLWMAYDFRQAKALGPVKVFTFVGIVFGLLVFVSTTVTKQKGYAGAGLNPARCLAAAIVKGGHLWDGLWIFWVAPAFACFAFYLYTKIIPREHFRADGYPHDLLSIVKVPFDHHKV